MTPKQKKPIDDAEKGIDGGWGWVVCAASFLVNFIVDGTMCSFGVLLLELLDYFGESKAKTSWIGSAQLGMSMIMGPFVSLLLGRFSCRQVTIAGTLITTAAFGVSVLSPNVGVMIFTYGVLGGIGISMSFISCIIAVSEYFRRKRALATCIAMSGAGFGVVVFPSLLDMLLTNFGWKFTVLTLAGIMFLCVFCGAVYCPLKQEVMSTTGCSTDPSDDTKNYGCSKEESLYKPEQIINKHIEHIKFPKSSPFRLTGSTGMLAPKTADSARETKPFCSHIDLRERQISRSLLNSNVILTQSSPMLRKDIFYSGSISRLHNMQSCNLVSIDDDVASDTEGLTSSGPVKSPTGNCVQLNRMLNFALFKDRTFILLLVLCTLWTVQSVPLTFVPDLAVSKGIPRTQAAILVSIIGFTNIIGRILVGILTDLCHIRVTVIYACALVAASVVNFTLPWCNSVPTLVICCGIFGSCMATVVSLRTILLAHHLGIDMLTQSFGMVALFQGITFMTNAPVAGILLEWSGSFVYPFIMSGSMYLVSATLCIAILLMEKCHGARAKGDAVLDIDINV